ncbi:MAG: hypothetical protein KDC27_08285 [Acidobacteria bacterium]|nr:hypothetical protein [Acidobacteriota bacterium]
MRWSLLCALSICLSVAQAAEPVGAPELTSIAPLGGATGTSFEATIRGKNLDGAASLWSPAQGVTAEVISIESGTGAKDPDVLHVRLRFADGLSSGAHDLRVVTPGGLSNALRLLAHAAPAILEAGGSRDTPASAQRLESWPAVVHGLIAEIGEVDYYAFQVEAGDELLFRSFSSPALDAGLAIYQKTGSWFDPERATRLAVNDEPVEYPGEPTEAVLRYRFAEAGEYLLRVNGFWGYGGVDQIYAVLIDKAPAEDEPWPPPAPAPLWTERDWRRPLDADRMARLAARTVLTEAPADIQILDADAEIYQLPAEPPTIEGPTLIRGAFEHPGDVDRVRFSAKEGDKLVFEITTPEKSLPEINPLLRVIDPDGNETLTNIWSRVNVNDNISKQIYPKTAYAFPRDGEFTLEIRDITATYGDRAMRYGVLVRPWVPHLGEAHVGPDRLNLVAGKADRVSVEIDQEEGYDGLAVFSIEGLPEGVEAVTGAEADPAKPPPFNEGKKERFVTESQKATFALLASPDAPLTREPVTARIYVRPAVQGALGEKILAKEILVMVVADSSASPDPAARTDAR